MTHKRPKHPRQGRPNRRVRRKRRTWGELAGRVWFLGFFGLVLGALAVNIVAHLWLEEWTSYDTWSLISSAVCFGGFVLLLWVADP